MGIVDERAIPWEFFFYERVKNLFESKSFGSFEKNHFGVLMFEPFLQLYVFLRIFCMQNKIVRQLSIFLAVTWFCVIAKFVVDSRQAFAKLNKLRLIRIHSYSWPVQSRNIAHKSQIPRTHKST